MYSLKYIRENTKILRAGLEKRGEAHRLDPILELDERRRQILLVAEEKKAERNRQSRLIGEMMKKAINIAAAETEKEIYGKSDFFPKHDEDPDELKREMDTLKEKVKAIGEKIKDFDRDLSVIEAKLNEKIAWLPNIPHHTVPAGEDASHNVEIKQWGEKLEAYFPPKDHLDLGTALGIIDFERAAKITGSGFPLYIGKGAQLERALINFMLDLHIKEHGYQEVFPPFMVNRDSLFCTGQIPKLEEDMYRCRDDDLYLIPTAEVPLTNIYREETFQERELPVKFAAYTACFRREAGSYGRETRGFLRVHQFNKVELVKFVHPSASYEEHEKLTLNAEKVLELLEIPYRRLELCAGDLGFAAAKCYDLEVWSPADEKWLEASSCSNFEDFQARRANIRFKPAGGGRAQFVHTINGSGLATSRLIVSLLENNQTEEGTVMVPKVLTPYTKFTIID